MCVISLIVYNLDGANAGSTATIEFYIDREMLPKERQATIAEQFNWYIPSGSYIRRLPRGPSNAIDPNAW
jgi:hypothetical protein